MVIQLPMTLDQLRLINACRQYLKIIYLSNICKSNDAEVNNNFLIGVKQGFPKSSYDWPVQTYPSSKAWKLWTKTLRQCFGIQNNNKLYHHLKIVKWIIPK